MRRQKLKMEIEIRRRQIEENIRLQNELKKKRLAASELKEIKERTQFKMDDIFVNDDEILIKNGLLG